MITDYRRILLLTEGRLGPFTSKTAASLLRYRADDIVGIVDSAAAGQDIREHILWSPPVPIVASVADAQPLTPDALFVGVAPVGGKAPPAMRRHIADALRQGIDVVSGLHVQFSDDPELSSLARISGSRIHDLRRPPANLPIAAARARATRCRRILTVGTDCNVGKMVAAIELARSAKRRGLSTAFVATGQTGIMISGAGISVDAVVSDFAAGAIEALILEHNDADLCIVEGQGSIAHPGFSGVTLSLLHGTCPDAMILVHHAGRTHHSAEPHDPIPNLEKLRDLYESAAAMLHPAKVVGVALNTHGVDADIVQSQRREIESQLGLPVCDPIADGCDALLDAALATPRADNCGGDLQSHAAGR